MTEIKFVTFGRVLDEIFKVPEKSFCIPRMDEDIEINGETYSVNNVRHVYSNRGGFTHEITIFVS